MPRAYSDKDLENIDPPPIEYEGKKYTHYEATQYQRKIETAIRKTKREIITADSAGDKDMLTAYSIKLRRQRELYSDFSKQAGLKTQLERTQGLEFDRSKAQKSVQSYKSLAKQANKMYNLGNEKDNIKAFLRDKPIREEIQSINTIKFIDSGKQGKHIIGHNNYVQGKSYLTISQQEAQELVIKHAGTGELLKDKKGKWINTELIQSNSSIGFVYNIDGIEIQTSKAIIHYSKTGTHIVPTLRDFKEVKPQ